MFPYQPGKHLFGTVKSSKQGTSFQHSYSLVSHPQPSVLPPKCVASSVVMSYHPVLMGTSFCGNSLYCFGSYRGLPSPHLFMASENGFIHPHRIPPFKLFLKSFCFKFLFFSDKVSQFNNSGCPGTRFIRLPLPLDCWESSFVLSPPSLF